MRDIDVNETSKIIKQTLRAAFPQTKFSVRLSKYSMGYSIDASWVDGPTDRQVNDILDRFNGKYFDGMDDSTHYVDKRVWKGEEVDFHSGYVRGQRRVSVWLMSKVASKVAREAGQDVPWITDYATVLADHNLRVPFQWHSHWLGDDKLLTLADIESEQNLLAHDSHEGEYFTRLIDKIAQHVSCEEQQPVELPEYLPEPASHEDASLVAGMARQALEDAPVVETLLAAGCNREEAAVVIAAAVVEMAESARGKR